MRIHPLINWIQWIFRPILGGWKLQGSLWEGGRRVEVWVSLYDGKIYTVER